MNGRKKLLSLVVLLSVLLIVPLVFSLGVVDVPQFLLGSSPASSMVEPASDSTPSVFVDPVYILDETKQAGSLTTFHINVSVVTDLFTWNVNITWNPAILNFSRVKEYGPFLRATTSPNGTSAWIDRDPTKNVTVAPFNNTVGYVGIAETILGEYLGITGDGRLVTIEFLVVDYGSTDLTISVSGTLPTTLLNSTGNSMTFTTTDGYFSNKIPGDVNGDRIVDGADFSLMGGAYRATPGDPNWLDDADINRDGIVDGADFSIAGGNYRREI